MPSRRSGRISSSPRPRPSATGSRDSSMLRDEPIPDEQLQRIDETVRGNWPTGEAVDFEEAIAFHESLPASKRFADVLENADRPLLQPRAGVARLDEQI